MTAQRTVKKSLIGQEDILYGESSVTQSRAGNNYTINEVRNIYPVNSLAERDALDTAKFTKCTHYKADGTQPIDYEYIGGVWTQLTIEVDVQPATIIEMTSNTGYTAGLNGLNLKERTTGSGGGGIYDVVLASSVTPNTYNIIAGVVDTSLAFVLRKNTDGPWTSDQFGVSKVATDVPGFQALIDQTSAAGMSECVISNGDYSTTTGAIDNDTTETNVILERGAEIKTSQFNWRVSRRTTELAKQGSLKPVLDSLLATTKQRVTLVEDSATRFEVIAPLNDEGANGVWRFDNAEGNFDGSSGFTRPYIITSIARSLAETYDNVGVAAMTLVGTWVVSAPYQYSLTATDTATYVFTGTRLRLDYLEATNAGIATITIDGAPANLVPTLDCYGVSGSTISVDVADELTDATHTVVVTVTGTKHASSSDFRIYIHDVQGLRVYTPLTDAAGSTVKTAFDGFSNVASTYYKLTNSAMDYAIAFRLNSSGAASTPFIGSVHGYEERQTIIAYVDGKDISLLDIAPYDGMFTGSTIQIVQTTKIRHPDDSGDFADVTITHTFSKHGYTQGTSWTWLKDVYIANGYSQMAVGQGGLLGGIPGDPNGWCNRAYFRGLGQLDVGTGDVSEHGHVITPEILLYGTPKEAGEPNRDADSGAHGMLINFFDIERSLGRFDHNQTILDGVWLQDNTTKKKVYVQNYRNKGTTLTGDGFVGSMSIRLYYSPNDGVYNAVR